MFSSVFVGRIGRDCALASGANGPGPATTFSVSRRGLKQLSRTTRYSGAVGPLWVNYTFWIEEPSLDICYAVESSLESVAGAGVTALMPISRTNRKLMRVGP